MVFLFSIYVDEIMDRFKDLTEEEVKRASIVICLFSTMLGLVGGVILGLLIVHFFGC